MSAVKQLHDGALVDAPPKIPEGKYQATYVRHETAFVFKTPKVFVHFKLHGGEYNGLRLYRAYRVHSLRGKPRKGGSFKLRHSHELYRQFVMISGCRERPDRISLSRLKRCLLTVTVKTVTRDAKQHELPPALQYSVIDRLVGVEAGQP